MFDVYEALKSGKSADEIAQSFVEELNTSIQKVEAEKQAEEAASRAAAERKTNAQAVADHINNFIKMYYPEKSLKFTSADVEGIFQAAICVDKIDNAETVNDVLDSFCNVLNQFFQENGI